MGLSLGRPPILDDILVSGERARFDVNGAQWFATAQILLFDIQNSGPTANRPTEDMYVAKPYFDVTIGTPIWWNGTDWIDAAGVVV